MELRDSVEYFAKHADSISSWTADERRTFYFAWAGTIRQLESEGAALPYYAVALAADPDPLVMAWDYFPGEPLSGHGRRAGGKISNSLAPLDREPSIPRHGGLIGSRD